jgi:VWFA-related protein
MSKSRLVRSLLVAAGVSLLAGSGPGGRVSGQQPAPPQTAPPQGAVTFRADASFVLTDVFVTADGKPVTDLTQADFEIREDGVVQKIQSFEAVRHDLRPAVGLPRKNPSSVAESEAMAADPRRRVFVIFLDTFHVERGDAMWVRKRLLAFFKESLGPDDLIAYMTPNMSGRDISFSTSTDPVIAYLDANPVWGVADEMAFTESDDIERNLSNCFPRDVVAWMKVRSRLREQKSIQALHGLVAYLDGLRESRKAVIAVTSGWRLFNENDARMTDADNRDRIGGLDPIGVNTGGVLGPDDRRRVGGVTQGVCDAARTEASKADSRQMFLGLIGEANRSSTSFYTVDARGLRSEGRPGTNTVRHPASSDPTSAVGEMGNRARMPYSTTLDSIRTLGESTNGMAIVDSNDVEGGMRRAAADFNSFYLLGYTSGNGTPDGKYRKIKVTVKRPGVRVRAREGYLARRAEETSVNTSSSAAGTSTPSPVDAQITAALGRLAPARPGVPLVVSATAGNVAGSTARAIRVTAELDSTIAATPEWADGGEAQAFVRDAKGDNMTTGKAALAKGARTVEIELPIVAGMAGDVKVQVRVSGTGALARYTDTTNVALDAAPAGWGAPRLSRRGPSTGIAWVPTADPRFRRQERLRVSLGVGAEAGTVTGTLLDRQGKPINVPVRIDRAEPEALVAELVLAPLAAGDYVLTLSGGADRLLVPIRVVP